MSTLVKVRAEVNGGTLQQTAMSCNGNPFRYPGIPQLIEPSVWTGQYHAGELLTFLVEGYHLKEVSPVRCSLTVRTKDGVSCPHRSNDHFQVSFNIQGAEYVQYDEPAQPPSNLPPA